MLKRGGDREPDSAGREGDKLGEGGHLQELLLVCRRVVLVRLVSISVAIVVGYLVVYFVHFG